MQRLGVAAEGALHAGDFRIKMHVRGAAGAGEVFNFLRSIHARRVNYAAVSNIGAPRVITTVCSKCAARLLSWVRKVQPSFSRRVRPVPAAITGSIVITSPSLNLLRAVRSAKFGTEGDS